MEVQFMCDFTFRGWALALALVATTAAPRFARPSREPPTKTAARWSLPLTLALTGTQADIAEAPLGTFAACEEMQRQ